MKYLLITVVTIFSSLSAICQELNRFVIKQKEKEEAIGVSLSCKKTTDGCLIFITDIEGIKFKGEITEQRFIPEVNKYVVCVDPNISINIELIHPDYYPFAKVFKTPHGGIYETYYITSEKARVAPLAKGEFKVTSEPEGAEIKIEGNPAFHERTPFTFKEYTAQPYKLILEKENYEKSTVEIIIDKRKSGSKHVVLTPMKGMVSITAGNKDAEGAKVFLNNDNVGNIPLMRSLIQNSYNLRIEKKGFSTIYDNFEITYNKQTQIPIKLYSKKEVSITSMGAKKGKVYIDQKYKGKTPLTLDLPLGSYSIQVEKKKHYSKLQDIRIDENTRDKMTYDFYLTKKEKPVIRKTGDGAHNALYSMILPGVGDYKVNADHPKGRKVYWLASMSYIGCVLIGGYSYYNYTEYYKKYHDATTQYEMDNNYNQASSSYQMFQGAAIGAATIWVFDVTYVAIKGMVNRHRHRRGRYSQNDNLNLYFNTNNNYFKLGLCANF